ncbi:MAG: response regulator [Nitrospirae bacterium]|nr:response regulator [Nitrospirota bacterium]
MVVICPKCRTRLKIQDEKISPEGSRFRCPRCSSVFLVRRPPAKATEIDRNLVMVAHADETVAGRAESLLRAEGYDVVTVRDGIEAMVTALNRLPFIAVIDVALPKIYGFEVCRRLKSRQETEDIGIILVPSLHDETKYRRPPSTLYGADDYVETHEMEDSLVAKVNRLKKEKWLGGPEGEEQQPQAPPEEHETAPPPAAAGPSSDEGVERARRFVRTVLSDLFIYNPQMVTDAVKAGNFREVFKSQLSEGFKLYQIRIPQEVRDKGDFFNEEIEEFIERKKKEAEA